MHEVTIPLRRFEDAEAVGSPEDYLRIIQDEYASRYLDLLGIASTPANKAAVMRCRPLDDCEVHGIWVEGDGSTTAEAIKIRPPLRQRIGDFEEVKDVDRGLLHHWYGQPERISVRPPDMPKRTIFPPSEHDYDTSADSPSPVAANLGVAAAGSATSSIAMFAEAAAQPLPTAASLEAEFERVRQELGVRRAGARVGGAVVGASGEPEAERFERFRQELATLKAKFILPFACERPRKEGSRWTVICPWPAEGSLGLEVPETLRAEALQPIGAELEDVRKSTTKWISETLPLEMLTSRSDEQAMAEVRNVLASVQVFQLVGLLAHLTYWLTLGAARRPGESRLSDRALQALFGAAQEAWSRFERSHRDSSLGVSLILPCFMLTLKRGVERCFEAQYHNIMAQAGFHQQLVDRINTLLMRLFDPDCFYARFGKFEGTGKAISLSRKLDLMASAQGHTGVKRLHSRAHRATPLVQSVLSGGAGDIGDVPGSGRPCDSRTRALLARGDLGGAPSAASVICPPQDAEWRTTLLKAAMDRLSIPEDGVLPSARMPGGPAGRRRRRPEGTSSGERPQPVSKPGVPPLPALSATPRGRPRPGFQQPATAR